MKRNKFKYILSLLVLLVTLLVSSVSVFAATGGNENSSSDGTSGSTNSLDPGFIGLRIYLYDHTSTSNTIITIPNDTSDLSAYDVKSNVSDELDAWADKGAIYVVPSGETVTKVSNGLNSANAIKFSSFSSKSTIVSSSKITSLFGSSFDSDWLMSDATGDTFDADSISSYFNKTIESLSTEDYYSLLKSLVSTMGGYSGTAITSENCVNFNIIIEPVFSYSYDNNSDEYVITFQDFVAAYGVGTIYDSGGVRASADTTTPSLASSYGSGSIFLTRWVACADFYQETLFVSSVSGYSPSLGLGYEALSGGDVVSYSSLSSLMKKGLNCQGYGIYGIGPANIDGEDTYNVAANITITYDGVAGTSSASDFDIYSEIVSVDSETSISAGDKVYDASYWSSKWKDVSTEGNQLGTGSTTFSDYDITMASIFTINTTKDTEYSVIDELTNLDTSDITINWGNSAATGGTFNAGTAYTLVGVNGYTSLTGILTDLASSSYLSSNSIKTVRDNASLTSYSDILKTLNTNLGLAINAASDEHTEDDAIKGEEIGVSVTILTKPTEVSSDITYVTFNPDTGSISVSNPTSTTYNTNNFGTFTLEDESSYIIVVPDTVTTPTSSTLKTALANSSSSTVLSKFKSQFTGGVISSQCTAGDTVTLGTLTSNSNSYGYSVYVLKVSGDLSVDVGLDLEDYELNYVYPTLIGAATGSTDSVTITDGVGVVDTSVKTSVTVPGLSNTYLYKTTDYTLDLFDSSSGITITADDKLNSSTDYVLGTFFINSFDIDTGSGNSTSTSKWFSRLDLLDEVQIESNYSSNLYADYAYNLVRGVFGDNRTLSSISSVSTTAKTYATTILDMDYDNVPVSVASVNTNNSNATYYANVSYSSSKANSDDAIVWDANYAVSNNKTNVSALTNTKVVTNSDGTEDLYVYNTLVSKANALEAYTYSGLTTSTFTVDVYNTICKYSVVSSDTGKNTEDLGTVAVESQASSNADEYAFAIVEEYDDITLKYYPEVYMLAYYYSGSALTSTSDVSATLLATMGEEKRESASSMLQILAVNNVSSSTTGTTYSDTYMTGSNVTSGTIGTITAGSDISLVVDTDIEIQLYGYALDLINSDVDKSKYEWATGTDNYYNNIVADGSDVYSEWGNTTSTTKLYEEFYDWTESVTTYDGGSNFGIDLYMDIDYTQGTGTDTSYNDFVTSIGSISGYETSENGVYSISIQYGEIVENDSYTAIIKQISEDYGCSTTEAKTIFEDSGLYTSILDAIVSSTDSNNKSQSSTLFNDDGSWYDEVVRTFVIRRYETTEITFSDIMVEDKLDYDTAPTTTSTTTTSVTADASWYFTLYMKNSPVGGNYDPSSSTTVDNSVLVNKLYIDGADFLIPNATTNDMTY